MPRVCKRRKKHKIQPYWLKTWCSRRYNLFRFQQRAVRWVYERRSNQSNRGCVLNIDYGLGKTLISLSHAASSNWQTLYLCPPNIIQHVRDEIEKHFGKTVSFLEAKHWDPFEFVKFDLILMSFYVLARLPEDALTEHPFVFQTCIIDEMEDAVHKATVFHMLQTNCIANYYVGLTGANRVTEPMLSLVRSQNILDVFTFRQATSFGRQTQFITLPTDFVEPYHALQTEIANLHGLKANKVLVNARTLVSRAKIATVLSLLSQLRGHKTLVVSEFSSSLTEIGRELQRYQQSHICYIAQKLRTQQKRNDAIHVFECNATVNIMLADLDLMCFGLDLGFVDVMLVMDLPMELLKYRQLQGRLRRLGQHAATLPWQHVVEIVMKDSCDFVLYTDIHSTKKYII